MGRDGLGLVVGAAAAVGLFGGGVYCLALAWMQARPRAWDTHAVAPVNAGIGAAMVLGAAMVVWWTVWRARAKK